MTKSKRKPLALSSHTIRQLDHDAISRVIGGGVCSTVSLNGPGQPGPSYALACPSGNMMCNG